MVMFLRFIVSAYIQQEAALFQFYTDGLPVEMFCQISVEPLDQDADQVQIMAAIQYFDLAIEIVYLDNTETADAQRHILPEGQWESDDIW